MGRSKSTSKPKTKEQPKAQPKIKRPGDIPPDEESICPTCGKPVLGHKCRLCGVTKTVNSVSGHVIWMRNGRLICAFHDSKEAYVTMALKYNIPKDRWPPEFRGD